MEKSVSEILSEDRHDAKTQTKPEEAEPEKGAAEHGT